MENTTRRLGNASKRLEDESPGPWSKWRTKGRAERAIRFMEAYCRPPKGYGAGRPLRLVAFQKDWLREVFAAGVNSAAMSLPRGNGKSTFLAGLATWALFDPDETGAAQVPIVATTVQQAVRTVYGVALAMVNAEPELGRRAVPFSALGNQKLTAPYYGGELFPISNDPDGLQGLDPSLAVCDEIGFMPVESWDSLLLASGKRPRSLVVGIGTPGFDKNNALWHLRTRVHSGAVLPGFRFTEYAASENCPVDDEVEWADANPALAGGYKNVDAMHTAVALSPESHFRIFQLGQWVDGTECWLGSDGRKTWDGLVEPFEFEPQASTWVGVDIAIKRDSTAVAIMQRRDDGRFHVEAKIWQPTPETPVDVTDVMGYIRQLDQLYRLEAVAFDPRFFDVPAKMLEDEGLPMVEVPQSIEQMTRAVGGCFEAIKRAELTHDGSVAFGAQVLNAVTRLNERGFTLAKAKSRGRIDAAIAMCLAHDRATHPAASAEVFIAWR